MFYTKDGIKYICKSKSFYGGEITLEEDMKLDNLDLILDLIDEYIDLIESLPSSSSGRTRAL